MLDNMYVAAMQQAVAWLRAQARQVVIEASGDVTLANAAEVAQTGVDVLSLGSITHSVKAANISMRMKNPLSG
jgi:nicotinate-nucleotide pyrophosphorylase (carboxylating)